MQRKIWYYEKWVGRKASFSLRSSVTVKFTHKVMDNLSIMEGYAVNLTDYFD
jgi:hypothetical protein